MYWENQLKCVIFIQEWEQNLRKQKEVCFEDNSPYLPWHHIEFTHNSFCSFLYLYSLKHLTG